MREEQKQFIFICKGKDCIKNGSKELAKYASSEIKSRGLKGRVEILKTTCTDRCKYGPISVCNNEMNYRTRERHIHFMLDSLREKV